MNADSFLQFFAFFVLFVVQKAFWDSLMGIALGRGWGQSKRPQCERRLEAVQELRRLSMPLEQQRQKIYKDLKRMIDALEHTAKAFEK